MRFTLHMKVPNVVSIREVIAYRATKKNQCFILTYSEIKVRVVQQKQNQDNSSTLLRKCIQIICLRFYSITWMLCYLLFLLHWSLFPPIKISMWWFQEAWKPCITKPEFCVNWGAVSVYTYYTEMIPYVWIVSYYTGPLSELHYPKSALLQARMQTVDQRS